MVAHENRMQRPFTEGMPPCIIGLWNQSLMAVPSCTLARYSSLAGSTYSVLRRQLPFSTGLPKFGENLTSTATGNCFRWPVPSRPESLST